MASNVSVTYNFVAGTDAVADQVDTNFNDVVSWVNTNAVHLDGTKAFTGIPSGPSSNPTTANQLARKAYVDSIAGIPIGGVTMWAGTTAPAGYLLCRGQAVNRGDYVDLFTIINETYGAGNGTTTFNVPNLQGRVPVGFDSTQTEFDALAETGGAKTVSLVEANLPAHQHAAGTLATSAHAITDPGHFHQQYTVATNGAAGSSTRADYDADTLTPNVLPQVSTDTKTTGITIANHTISGSTGDGAGTGAAHNNLQPYVVLNYIIRAI